MASAASSPGFDADVVPDGTGRTPSAARRARKRATDRRSQRNHRERQRAYVRSLETTVSALNNASNSDERVAALSAENETLRTQCQHLTMLLSRIRTIACEKATPTGLLDQPPCTPASRQREPTISNSGLVNDDAQPVFDGILEPVEFNVSPPVAFPNRDNPHEPPLLEQMTESHSIQPDVFPTLCSHQYSDLGSLVPSNNILPMETPSRPCHSPGLPDYAHPKSYADTLLHAMLDEAIAEYRAGRFDTAEPSLKRLLTHGPVDILSFRLFHYINQYGAMPMHWMLAIFWVQYLFLRWNVLKTDEAYALVPEFMRPTPLEFVIPHRISINMIVWPDVRQALIRDALTVSPEDVGVALLQSLSPSWMTSLTTGNMIASMDVYEILEKQALQKEFWRAGPDFLKTYPQYQNCDLGVV